LFDHAILETLNRISFHGVNFCDALGIKVIPMIRGDRQQFGVFHPMLPLSTLKVMQKEPPGAAYASAGTLIAGHPAALGIDNQATQIDFSGRMRSAKVVHNSAVESAKVHSNQR
jgi:hypothetical protein